MPIFALLISTLLLISACGTLQPASIDTPEQSHEQPVVKEESSSVNAPKPTLTKPIETRPFPVETFYDLLVAEIAANRRQYQVAVDNYVRQAEATEDIAVIARAARIAQFFRDYPKAVRIGSMWHEKTPDDIEALSLLITAHIELKAPEAALNHAEKLLALLDPNDKKVQQQAAITETIANRSQGQTPDILQTLATRYRELSNQYPLYPAIRVGLSKLYELLGNSNAAYATIEQTLGDHPAYMPAIMQQVRLLQLDQKPDAAIERLEEQLAEQPDNTRLQLVYARLLMQTDPQKAYEELTKLSSQSPDENDITFLRALVALEIDKLQVAQSQLTKLLSKNYRPNTVNFYLGNLESERGNNELALDYYLNVRPSEEYISAQTLAGGIIARTDGFEAAHQHFKQKRANSPRFRPQLYIAEANLLDQEGEKDRAIKVLSEALAEYPDNISLRYNRSTYYEQQDKLGLMEDDLRHILAIDPDNASALNALGYVLTNKTDRHQEALPLIQRALELRPEDAAITDSMGWVLYRLGRFEEAITYLRKAFSLFPDPEVAAHLGEVLWIVGEQEEAKSIWRGSLEKNPDDTFIPETMRRFNLDP